MARTSFGAFTAVGVVAIAIWNVTTSWTQNITEYQTVWLFEGLIAGSLAIFIIYRSLRWAIARWRKRAPLPMSPEGNSLEDTNDDADRLSESKQSLIATDDRAEHWVRMKLREREILEIGGDWHHRRITGEQMRDLFAEMCPEASPPEIELLVFRMMFAMR